MKYLLNCDAWHVYITTNSILKQMTIDKVLKKEKFG